MHFKILPGLLLLASIFVSPIARAEDDFAIPINQVNQCLKAAIAAQQGNIAGFDLEVDDDIQICGVEIYNNKQKFDVEVNLKNYRVIKVEKSRLDD